MFNFSKNAREPGCPRLPWAFAQSPTTSLADMSSRQLMAYLAIALVCFSFIGPATAQEAANQPLSMKLPDTLAAGPKAWASPEGLSSTLQVMLLLTVLSLAPAVLLMTTCFVRIIVVLSLLRQAIGTQQLPPSQVITTLALFLTFLIMAPVWKQVYNEAIVPYTEHRISMEEAMTAGTAPVRRFMSQQIERTKNTEDVYLVPQLPSRSAHAAKLRRRAAGGLVAGVHAQRIENRVFDRLPDLSAVFDPRHGRGQRDGFDGHDDAPAGHDLVALQTPVVRAPRRLAPRRRHVDGKFSTVYVTKGLRPWVLGLRT